MPDPEIDGYAGCPRSRQSTSPHICEHGCPNDIYADLAYDLKEGFQFPRTKDPQQTDGRGNARPAYGL
jgi:hypothetical protein